MTNTEIQVAEKHIIQVENHHSLCFHPPPFAESRQRQSWSAYKKDVLESVRLIAERAKPDEGVVIILVGHWHSRTKDEFILGDHDQPDQAFLSVRELEVILRGTKARVTLVPQTCYDDFWKSPYWTLLTTDYCQLPSPVTPQWPLGSIEDVFWLVEALKRGCEEYKSLECVVNYLCASSPYVDVAPPDQGSLDPPRFECCLEPGPPPTLSEAENKTLVNLCADFLNHIPSTIVYNVWAASRSFAIIRRPENNLSDLKKAELLWYLELRARHIQMAKHVALTLGWSQGMEVVDDPHVQSSPDPDLFEEAEEGGCLVS